MDCQQGLQAGATLAYSRTHTLTMLNEGYSYRHALGSNAKGHTAGSFLAAYFAHSSAEEWLARLASGEILVDGVRAEAERPLRPGQILIWNRPPWREEETPLAFGIAHRDECLLVVDKPSGLPTLPGGGFYRHTLLLQVRAHYPTASPVHRLGRGTSGLVVFALDSETAAKLQRGWGEVRKQYRALASGQAQHDAYDIRCPIGQCEHPRLGEVHAALATGKAARSVARVLERRDRATLFEVDLHTGRPHQIRIHLASIGHPLIGDPLYGIGGVPLPDRPGLPGDLGYHLHAMTLSLAHPSSGKRLELVSPPPPILRGA